jgi:septal ring factor EnvC (AmiA/AmiB activator)
LDEARTKIDGLASQIASANTKIGSLEEELFQYKERFKVVRNELQVLNFLNLLIKTLECCFYVSYRYT